MDEQFQITKNINNPLINASKLAKRHLFSVGFISFFINLSMLTVPLYMLQLYDRVLTSRNEYTLLFLTIVAVFLLIVIGALELTRSRILVRIGNWFDAHLRRWIMHLSLTRGQDSLAIRDLDDFRVFLTGPGLLAIFDAPWTPIYIAAIFLLHPMLGWIALGGAIVLAILAVLAELLTRAPLSEAGYRTAKANRFSDKASRNSEVIRAMAMSTNLVSLWEKDRIEANKLQSVGSDRAGTISALAKFLRLGLQVAILGCGAWLAIRQLVSPGVMVAASIIMGRALAPIESAIGSWRGVITARNAYRRLSAFLNPEQQQPDRMSLPDPVGHLKVEDLLFIPPEQEKPILSNVTFELKAGESLGIIGPSGIGKSTLIRLVMGLLRPTKGRVLIDGFSLDAWDRHQLGPRIGYLPQDVELFDGRIDQNIARFGEVDPEKVVKAAKLAGVYEMVSSFSDGFNTNIGIDNKILSGGQKQRLALARALYGDPAIIILDEPSSNLDADGERVLRETLRSLKAQGTTVIVITHRPNLICEIDKLLVIEESKVAMFGDTNEIFPLITRPTTAVKQQEVR